MRMRSVTGDTDVTPPHEFQQPSESNYLVYEALRMEAVQTSDMQVNLHQSTRRYNPDDSHLHTHRRENLKSYY
jgi:hypothetical protein